MKPGRGKRVALVSVAVGLAVMAMAAISARGWFAETWWIYKLSSPEPHQQIEAAQELGELRSRRAIPELVKLYQRDEAGLRENLLKVIINIGPEALAALLQLNPWPETVYREDPEFLNAVVACLDHPDPVVRCRALRQIKGYQKEDRRPHLARLKSTLENETSPWARLCAAELVAPYSHSPKAVSSAILNALNPGDEDLRGESIRILREMGTKVEYLFPEIEAAIPVLPKTAQADSENNQKFIELAILQDALLAYPDRDFPCPRLEALVPELIRCLKDPRGGVREQAVMILAKIGPPARNAAPALVEMMLEETTTTISWRAFLCLGAIGPPARTAVLGFIELIRQREPVAADEMREALDGLEEDPELVLDLLKIVKDDEDWYYVRDLAAQALARVGRNDERAVRALLEMLAGSSGPWMKESAAVALGTMGREQAVPVLRKILADADPFSQPLAARALGMIGHRAAECVPELIRQLPKDDRTAQSGYQVALALWKIAGDAKSAAPVIIKSIEEWDDGSPRNTREAIRALGEMGPAATKATAVIVPLLGRQFATQAASETLVKFGAASVPGLVDSLHEDDWFLRRRAAQMLGTIGPAAKEALPALQKLVQDPESDEELSQAAAEAVAKIRGGSR